MVRFRTPALVHAGRIAGSISFVGGAVGWLWLGVSPTVAGRIGDLSLFGLGYLALGIVLNLVAAFILARLSRQDGLQFWLPIVAMTSTVTLFSGESPLGVGSPTAATVLVPLILVQGACALLVLDAEQVRRNTSEVITPAARLKLMHYRMNGTASDNELEALERRGWEALSGPHGATFYDKVMADDGLMVFPGLVMDKRTALDVIRKAAPWSGFALHDVRVTATDQVGLVTYKAIGQRSAQPPYEAVMSSVYAREGDDWRLLLHQQSP